MAAVHFNWTQLAPEVGYHYVHVATLSLSVVLLTTVSLAARHALGSNEQAYTPSKSLGLKAIFEGIIDFIVTLVDLIIGKEGRKFAPMFATIFLFIFANNILGLVPGFTPATENINTTVAIGVFAFVVYNYFGFREHGIGYLKQLMGPLLLLAPILFVIELISHFVRPFTLGLRLQGNMMADHILLGVFLELAPYLGIPVIFYGLGLFVSFMQAFVFTMLCMIYISLAISHDH